MNKTGSVWDAVGDTPLLKIESLSRMSGCEIFGKAEFLNPGGSVKDRAAKGIIAQAERDGTLKPGGTIVEGTAGNTGIGIATLAAARGYKTILTMPDNQAQEKYDLLRSLGADVRTVPPVPFANPNHFFHAAKKIVDETPGAVWANQFENTANGDMHFATTGPEIWEQTGGRVDTFVCAVGSSGTISGVSRFLKGKKPEVRIVAADPLGSGIFCHIRENKLEAQGSSITEGIGIMRLTANYLAAKIDDAIRIDDTKMLDMLYYLARYEGLVVGTSAALNVYAAFSLALANRGSGKTFVTVLCDHGTRYTSRVFNPDWLKGRGLEPHPERIIELSKI